MSTVHNDPRSRPAVWRFLPTAACAAIVFIGAIVYANSFFGPFVLDDRDSILGNPTILHLSRWSEIFDPPSVDGAIVGGRPLLNLSLAFNYALSGTGMWSYHAFNLVVHVLAALTLTMAAQ